MNKYIILIALVALRIVYHPSPVQTTLNPFESTSPIKVQSNPDGSNKLVPGAGIISTQKVIVNKAAENNKLVTKKYLRYELVWRQRVYYCTRLLKKYREATIAETFLITTSA